MLQVLCQVYGPVGSGQLYPHEGQTTVALLPDRLRKILASSGYQLDAVLPGWKESGDILIYPSQRPTHTTSRLLAGSTVRVIVFAPGTVIGGEPDAGEE